MGLKIIYIFFISFYLRGEGLVDMTKGDNFGPTLMEWVRGIKSGQIKINPQEVASLDFLIPAAKEVDTWFLVDQKTFYKFLPKEALSANNLLELSKLPISLVGALPANLITEKFGNKQFIKEFVANYPNRHFGFIVPIKDKTYSSSEFKEFEQRARGGDITALIIYRNSFLLNKISQTKKPIEDLDFTMSTLLNCKGAAKVLMTAGYQIHTPPNYPLEFLSLQKITSKQAEELITKATDPDLIFPRLPHTIRSNRNLTLALFKRLTRPIYGYEVHASLRGDREIGMLAVSRGGEILKFLSEDLRSDQGIVMAAVVANPKSIKFVSDKIAQSAFFLKLIESEPTLCDYLSEKILALDKIKSICTVKQN